MYLVDRGETLGPTLGLFREGFFTSERNYFSKNPYAMNHTFKKNLRPQLSKLAQHRSLTYTADECIDLPPELPVLEYIKLPPDTKAYYDELVAEMIAAKGNMRAVKNAFLRMRQLSSGFLGMKDDETGERAEIEFQPNPKLERLLDLADTFPEGRKALIFYQYTYSGRKIVQEFKKEFKLDVPWLWSGTKDSRKTIRTFIEDPDIPFCLVNNQVGAYSLDGLQVANYEFFYESPLSAIDKEQAKRRVRRQGQRSKTVFYYELIMRGTVDEKILTFHKEGKDLFESLLVNPQAVLR
jgi:SNF2 family DNA or RNA helicase